MPYPAASVAPAPIRTHERSEMSIESLQTLSQIVALVGLLATGLGGFGSYYFGQKVDDARAEEFRTRLDGLLADGKALGARLEPFYELARAASPGLDQDAALARLREEIERLREIAAKHEFTPLTPPLRAQFVTRVRSLAPELARAGFSVLITHETWSPPPTRQYAAQLAELLMEGGLQVEGPKAITYFLVTPPSPLEWGCNEADLDGPHLQALYRAVLTIIEPNEKWTKASHQQPGSVRIHFGGEVVFQPDGRVAVI